MSVSVIDPISLALTRTGKTLFRPFDFAKWTTMGFCAWVAHLGQDGFNANLRMPFGGGAGAPMPGGRANARPGAPPATDEFQKLLQSAVKWIEGNLTLVVALGAAVALAGIALWMLIAWLKARATFMFLDNVVRDRGEVAQPWTEYTREGNSLFRFVFCFGLATSLLMLLLGAVSGAIAWPDLRAGRFGNSAVAGLVVFVPLASLLTFASLLIQVLLVDFVVPLMYLRRQRVMDAWNEFNRSILSGHFGTMVLYLFLRLVIGFITALIAFVATCATCCIAALPYVGTVILLPIFVFNRAFPLYVLEQYGADWQIFPSVRKPSHLAFDDLPPAAT